ERCPAGREINLPSIPTKLCHSGTGRESVVFSNTAGTYLVLGSIGKRAGSMPKLRRETKRRCRLARVRVRHRRAGRGATEDSGGTADRRRYQYRVLQSATSAGLGTPPLV